MTWTHKIEKGDVVRLATNTGYETVEEGDKLHQDCQMILTTGIRASGVGCGLDQAVGRATEEPEIGYGTPSMFLFQQLLRDGINRFRWNQRNYQFMRRSARELLDNFSPAHIWQDGTDPRLFRWRVNFYTLGRAEDFFLTGTVR